MDPSFQYAAHPDPTFYFERIRFRFLMKVIICHLGLQTLHGSHCEPTGHYCDHPRLQSEPPWLHFGPQHLVGFDYYADPDPNSTFHSDANPDLDPIPRFLPEHSDNV
jgi:hypothetical protein